ncbi:tRNA-dihydrouridine synthase [bacterium]|nr:MAG: tRNA-dihydrouridine synthase [bacterium]
MNNFWKNLPKPFFALAPMYDVTDAAFRIIIAKYGKPDVFYTEFTSTDGLMSAGREKLLHHLQFSETEHPIVAQVFGTKPEKYFETAKLCRKLGFDGMDINMGCPDKNIIKGGSCAALYRTPDLAKEIVIASKLGWAAEEGQTYEDAMKNLKNIEELRDVPISVKIRIGDTVIDWESWIKKLLEAEPAAIGVHLRTRKEMSKVPAHWELMPEIVKFIHDNTTNQNRPRIIGNGDVENLTQAAARAQDSGCDGVMLGRAIFGNPWLFTEKESVRAGKPESLQITKPQKLQALLEHVELYGKIFTGLKPFDVMKRHFKAYIHGFDNAAELRAELYEYKTAEEVIEHIKTQN